MLQNSEYPHTRSTEALEGFAAYRGCQAGCNYARAFEKDGYSGWSKWLKKNGITECACNAHARREFEESKAEDPLPSRVGLGFYTLLNMVERYIKAEGLTGKRKKDIRMDLKIPIMPIDNNACERGFKPLVKGRKTSLFFQNLMGAWRASMMYSFFETCAMNHLNPQQWLTYVLNNIKTTPEDQLPNLLPQNFDKSLLKLV